MPRKKTKAQVSINFENTIDIMEQNLILLQENNPDLVFQIKLAIQQIQTEKEGFKEQVKTLLQENDLLKSETKKTIEQIIDHRKEYEKVILDYEKKGVLLQQQIDQLNKTIVQSTMSHTKDILDLSGSLYYQIGLKDKELVNLQNQIDKKNILIHDTKIELESVSKHFIQLKKDYAFIKEDYDKVVNELQQSKKKIEELEKEISDKSKTMQDLIQQASEFQTTIKKNKSKCTLL